MHYFSAPVSFHEDRCRISYLWHPVGDHKDLDFGTEILQVRDVQAKLK